MKQEDRGWSICVALCMQLFGGMRLVSIEQLLEGVGQMIVSGYLGKAFDGMSRKSGASSIMKFAISFKVFCSNFTGCAVE